jgi:hypothetical protein
MRYAPLLAAAALAVAAPGSAQSVGDRIAAVKNGVVRMSFASRPDVCTDGSGSTWTSGRRDRGVCLHGPIRVTIGRDNGQTISVRTRVGGHWGAASGETDLGTVDSKDAALYLASAARSLAGRNADDALSAAALADGVDLAPALRELVLDADVRLDTRKQALFWLGQTELPTHDLAALYDRLPPHELREHFTFVLSQRQDDDGVTKLMDIARGDRDAQVRKQAMFWLGQSRDPRATKFFRDILTP